MSEKSVTAVPIPAAEVKVYNAEHIRSITITDEFELTDLMLQDRYGTVAWTTVYTTLFGRKQSLYFNANKNIRYEILSGEAWFTMGKRGEVVTAGDHVLVEAGSNHKLYNTSRTAECKYKFDFPGLLDLRKYLNEDNFTIEG